MIIGIIVAMQKELDLLLPLLEDLQTPTQINGYTFHTGTLGRHGIIAMQCGIGKVNSAIGALTLLDGFHPDYIINSGVAGGAGHTHVLDLLVADAVAYHDVWCGPGTEYGAAAGLPVILRPWQKVIDLAREIMPAGNKTKFGLICSGDKFISSASEVKEIQSHFPDVMAVDMESASIAQVCYLRNVPFNILRVISDTPGETENISQYESFWTDAPKETFAALTSILKQL
ncbi:MAG: 5'-methylthioadenosine/adenosylhomocysteine nucleosidase [Prevotella sp.]|nr:5'-methylthioadenosine/adenosylhomocysteine nucleosidase [Prevotella sp.]MCM1074654.1 5'-methylthioadenosine/adenosylhomocysteine nucleosidase [Ruminococcus sp.]